MAIIDEDKNKNGELVVNGNTIKGVNEETQAKATSSFQASDTVTNARNEQASALSGVKEFTGKDSIVSQGTWDTINSSFKTPNSVKQADKWLSSQLQTIQSGKTSYSDQVRGLIDKIMGREEFSYDVDKDPLFQQALASSMSAGKQAMQDTIGQASALTGGYGSTYATSVGNQTYNSFIEDAYDNLPQYYQMALDAYNAEGDELYRQYGMLSAEDDKEFNRNVTAYDATYQHRNRMYDEAYGQFRDSKSDAFASANLQISEHGQLSSDAYNYYNATSDFADSLYAQEFDVWNAEVNQAMQWAGMQNSDYWNQANQDFTASENQKDRDLTTSENALDRTHQSTENQKDRDHQTAENQAQRDWQTGENQLDREHQTAENQAQRDWQTGENALDRTHQSTENQKDREHQTAENQKDREHQTAENQAQRDWQTGENQKDRDLTVSENDKNRSSRTSGSSGGYKSGSGGGGKEPTQSQKTGALKAYNEGGEAEYYKYLDSLPSNVDTSYIDAYVFGYVDEEGNEVKGYGELPYSDRKYTVIDDGGINLWGLDKNVRVRDQYGHEYTLEELAVYDEDLAKQLSHGDVKTGKTYTKRK